MNNNPVQRIESAQEFKVDRNELAELIVKLNGEVEDAIAGRASLEQQLIENYRHRRGLIGRPFPNMPFHGAADIRFPIIDKYLERIKAVFFNSVIDSPHAARFIPLTNPSAFDSAQRLELFFDWLTASDPEWRATVDCLIDRALEQGKCVAKITYEIQTETRTEVVLLEELQQLVAQAIQQRATAASETGLPLPPFRDEDFRELLVLRFGFDPEDPIDQKRLEFVLEQVRRKETEIKVVRNHVVKHRPVIGAIPELTDIIVPGDTTSIQNAEWVAHDLFFTKRQLRQQSKDCGGKYDNVEEVIEATRKAKSTSGNELRDAVRLGEFLDDSESDLIRVRELYCWLPVKYVKRLKGRVTGGEETPVRCVVTYCPDTPGVGPLRVMELPYDHNRWPFEEYNYHSSRQRFYDCRGLPQLLKAFQEEYNISRNAAINRRTLTLSPPVLVHSASKINANNFRQVGQVFQTSVPPAAAIHIPQFPDLSSGFEFDAHGLEQFVADYIGMPDLRMRGYSDSPTATQVEQVQGPATAMMRRELELFHDFLGRVFWHVFMLEKQFRFSDPDQRAEFANVSNPEQQTFVTADDFAHEFIIQSGADLQRLDGIISAQQLFIAYQAAMTQPQIAPMIKPYDVQFTTFSKMIGPVMARQWLRSREEAAKYEEQFLELQAQAAAQMQVKGRNPRNMRPKQIPNAHAGIVPQ